MRRIKKLLLVTCLFSMVAMTLSGCAYVNNRNWDDMTPEEQEEVRQVFEEERRDLEENFSDDGPEGEFVRYILDQVEKAVE